MRSAYPPKPLVTPLCMWDPMGNVITDAQFQLNRFRGYGAIVTPNSLFPIHSDHDPYNRLALPYGYTVLSGTRHRKSRPALHCRVLPPRKFNGTIPEPLAICSYSESLTR